jgi:hypothetical protein
MDKYSDYTETQQDAWNEIYIEPSLLIIYVLLHTGYA